MELRNKTILVLSPQSWGTMFLSKHHYACTLEKRNNRVYFLDPPEMNNTFGKSQIEMNSVNGYENLKVIHHRPWFSKHLYFHCPALYQILMRRHINKIIRCINQPIDIVWSFDIGNLYPLRLFSQPKLRIFHPVDEPLTKNAIAAAEHSNIIFSVTKEILHKYAHLNVPRFLINHGVSELFFKKPIVNLIHDQIRVGFSGNLTRRDIDRFTLLRIIQEHPACEFHIWGVYDAMKSNIAGNNDPDTHSFIQELQKQKNIILYGPVPTSDLVVGYAEMDLFLICYDIQKDQSKGTNYHKVMEFLSTGKPVVSNNITAFNNSDDLVYMSPERDSNLSLPDIFSHVVSNLKQLNTTALQEKRRSFAYDNMYERQIERIESILKINLKDV